MMGKVVLARPAQVLVQEIVASPPAVQMVEAMGAPYLRGSAKATVATVEAAMARRAVVFMFVVRRRRRGRCVVVVVGRG
jgi:hypothetical protein